MSFLADNIHVKYLRGEFYLLVTVFRMSSTRLCFDHMGSIINIVLNSTKVVGEFSNHNGFTKYILFL